MTQSAVSETPRATSPMLPAAARRYVVALSLASGTVVAGSIMAAALLWPRDAGGALLGLLFLGLVAAAFVLERRALVLHWRGQRTMSSFDEPVVFLALLALPTLALIPLIACSMALVQLASRRAPVKALFNIGAYSAAAAIAVGACALVEMRLGWPPLAGALVGLVAYTTTSNALVAGLFGALERKRVAGVFRERFLVATLVHLALGASLGLVLVALWSYHPLATLVVVPFAALAVGFVRLSARGEREVEAHRRLAEMSAQLAGTRETDAVAQRVLDTVGDLFVAGRATIDLERPGDAPRHWSRDYEGGADPARAAIAADILGKDGRRIGALAIHRSRRVHDDARAADPHLLRVVAAQTAGALENAWALDQINVMRDEQRGIVENVPAGVARLDAMGRVAQINPVLRDALANACPDGPLEAWPDIAPDAALREALVALRQGKPFTGLEARVGGRHHLVAGVPVGTGRSRTGAIVLFHDITGMREAQEAMRAQTVTRPLVRRMILDLVGNLDATRFAVAEMGRSLAREMGEPSVEGATDAFRAMGLGTVQLERQEGGAYRFVADDLLERRPASLQPTCHLALGFLEGLVGKVHKGNALGSEVRCQSQGHEKCVFVVKPRE